MKPRIKLLTLWVGPLPNYALDFARRARDIKIIDWELLWFGDVEQVNRLVTERLGTPCRKQSGYALSDLRPMLARMFPYKVDGFDWWGWVEIDTVLGDLDNLLPQLLWEYHAISCFPNSVSGPLMLLYNFGRINDLFHAGDWLDILAEPTYCNFEETQRENGGLTKLLKDSGLKVYWDNRFSLTYESDPAHPTPAGCRLEGNKLIEEPSERELLIYHFNHLKRWPMGLPVSETEAALERRKGL